MIPRANLPTAPVASVVTGVSALRVVPLQKMQRCGKFVASATVLSRHFERQLPRSMLLGGRWGDFAGVSPRRRHDLQDLNFAVAFGLDLKGPALRSQDRLKLLRRTKR